MSCAGCAVATVPITQTCRPRATLCRPHATYISVGTTIGRVTPGSI